MRTLRGVHQGIRLTAFIIFALAVASLLTLSHSRPSYAESPSLLGTVRCLLQTVLLSNCPVAASSPPAEPSSPERSAPPASPPSSSQASGESTSTTPQAHPVKQAPVVTQGQEMALPDQTMPSYPSTDSVTNATSPRTLNESEYIAYFNTFSPYAVAGAHTEAIAQMPLQQSNEGWKLFGIAWYWWALAFVAIGMIIFSVRRRILRKPSVLLRGE